MSNAVATGWPSGSGNLGWGQEPTAMLMPGRVQGWPAGTQRAANPATQLLTQAVAYWDVANYRDGDRFLRNQGTGGELLDLRLGSSIVANSNDPLFLRPEDLGYVYMAGGSGNVPRISVPDEAALRVTGDLDIRARIAPESWAPGAERAIVGKWNQSTTANQAGYSLRLLASGAARLYWSPDGTAAAIISATSTTNVNAGDGDAVWVRATLDVDNGAGTPQYEVRFFTSVDGTTWTQLGTTVIGATGPTSVHASTHEVAVGIVLNSSGSGVFHFVGKVYAAQIWDGIEGSGGTKVLDIDCDVITSGSATSFTAGTGQTVSINRSTSGRKSVAVPSRSNGGRPRFLFGTDDFLTLPDENAFQHGLLNFMQGDSGTALIAVRQWATPVSAGRYLSKYDSASGAGWSLQSTTTTQGVTATLTDGTTTGSPASAASTSGLTRVFAVVIDRAAQTATSYLNGTAGTPVAIGGVGNLANVLPFRIGRQSSGSTTYQDFEFLGAAVFRNRRLTASELSSIATSWGA